MLLKLFDLIALELVREHRMLAANHESLIYLLLADTVIVLTLETRH